MSRTDHVPKGAKQHGGPPHQTSPIHVLGANLLGRRPEGEEECDASVYDTDNVEDRRNATQFPRTQTEGFPEDTFA